jgi:hypothetical protein
MIQFRFFNILISHKTQLEMIDMPLKWHIKNLACEKLIMKII